MNNKLHPTTSICLFLGILVLSIGFHCLSIKRVVRRETNASILLAERVKKNGHYKIAILISYKVRGVAYRARKFVSWSSAKDSRLRSSQLLKVLKRQKRIKIYYQVNNPRLWHFKLTRATSR